MKKEKKYKSECLWGSLSDLNRPHVAASLVSFNNPLGYSWDCKARPLSNIDSDHSRFNEYLNENVKEMNKLTSGYVVPSQVDLSIWCKGHYELNVKTWHMLFLGAQVIPYDIYAIYNVKCTPFGTL